MADQPPQIHRFGRGLGLAPFAGLIKSTSSGVSAAFRAEQVAFLHRGSAMMLTNLPALPIVCWVLHPHVPTLSLALWVAAMLAVLAARGWLRHRFDRSGDRATSSATWANRLSLVAGASGLTWGGLAFVLPPGTETEILAFVASVIVGMTSCAVATMAVYRPAFLAYLLAATLPIVLTALVTPQSPIHLAIAGLLALYIVGAILVAELFRSTVEAGLRLKSANAILMDELEATQQTIAASVFENWNKLATINHELRTPLNAIIGFSDVMAQETFGPLGSARYADYARHIRQSGRDVLSSVDRIAEIADAETGRLKLAEHTFELNEVLDELVAMTLDDALTKGIGVMLVRSSAVLIYADEEKIRQIVSNLLVNALRFTPKGGSVTIRPLLAGNGDVLVSIHDSGPGIDPALIERSFMPFERLGSALHASFGGLGLGLPLCRHLAKLHGGDVTLECGTKIGTTAILRLPANRRRVHRITDAGAAA